ncbi:hypothetical protein WMY93_030258 [Mugilogobius chulae]|uniref:Uncharacterized protein n=1 Tax=Mugilogobius chulae TaxID=88201 RepID=A0AAW0MVL2_9GOBI
MAGTIMLAYYFEYTDTFSVHVQGFFCYDTTYTKPYLGPEDSSAVPPVLLYALVAGLPTLLVSERRRRRGKRGSGWGRVLLGRTEVVELLCCKDRRKANVMNGI